MPNHVENDLYLVGSDEDVARVLAHIGADKPEQKFDFSSVIQYPAQFKEMDDAAEVFAWRHPPTDETKKARESYIAKYGHDRDGYNSGGYEWRSANWGTKWNAYSVKRTDYEEPRLTFQTAWAPPSKVVIALATLFPTVTFRLEYFERGMGFCGGFECPSQEDYYGEDKPWSAGIVTHEWESKEYRGGRGG